MQGELIDPWISENLRIRGELHDRCSPGEETKTQKTQQFQILYTEFVLNYLENLFLYRSFSRTSYFILQSR